MPETLLPERSVSSVLAEKWVMLQRTVGTLAREQIRLNEWIAHSNDDCRYWMQCLTSLLETARELQLELERQGCLLSDNESRGQLLHRLDSLNVQGKQITKEMGACAAVDQLSTEDLDLPKVLKRIIAGFAELLVVAQAIEEKLALILSEQGLNIQVLLDEENSPGIPSIPMYPTGYGAYAIGHPQGRTISVGWPLTVRVGGRHFTGQVQQTATGYHLQMKDGSRCGFCPAMAVVFPPLEEQHLRQELRIIERGIDREAHWR